MRKPYERRYKGKFLGWYILHEGKQVWLGRFEAEARENLKLLMDGQPIIKPGEEVHSSDTRLQEVVDTFLDYHKIISRPKTYEWYRNFLKEFCPHFGNVKVSTLTPRAVLAWLATKKNWGDNSRHGAVRAIKAAMRHALESRVIRVDPLAKLKRPRAVAREGAELTPEQWAKILEHVSGDFRDILLFLRLTGCRPQEARAVEARHFRSGVIVFPRVESKGKLRERVIWLGEKAKEIVVRLVAKYPTGPIFRRKGKAWSPQVLVSWFKRLKAKTGIPNLCAYSIRHTYATECVINGMDSIILAKLMGHSNTKMLEAVYAKHGQRTEFMAGMAEKAVGGV